MMASFFCTARAAAPYWRAFSATATSQNLDEYFADSNHEGEKMLVQEEVLS